MRPPAPSFERGTARTFPARQPSSASPPPHGQSSVLVGQSRVFLSLFLRVVFQTGAETDFSKPLVISRASRKQDAVLSPGGAGARGQWAARGPLWPGEGQSSRDGSVFGSHSSFPSPSRCPAEFQHQVTTGTGARAARRASAPRGPLLTPARVSLQGGRSPSSPTTPPCSTRSPECAPSSTRAG